MGTNPKVITYVEECMNNAQWTYIEYYQRNGYKLDPVKKLLADKVSSFFFLTNFVYMLYGGKNER